MAAVPSPPLLGLYNANGTFPTGGPSAWASGPTTNLAAEYFDFESGSQSNVSAFITKCNANSLTPFVELEPWLFTASPATAVPLTAITGGTYDPFLTAVGTAIAGSARPVMITWGHEFNVSGQYPWAFSLSGSPYSGKGSGPGGAAPTAAQWVTAYKYVYNKINSTANGNALWVWACNADTGGSNTTSPANWWPGSAFVQMVGVDGYIGNEGAPTTWAGEFNAVFSDIRSAPVSWSGPVFISETSLSIMVANGGPSITSFVASMVAAGGSGVLQYQEAGATPYMTQAQWNEYNAAILAHFPAGGGGGGGTLSGGLLMVGIA